VCLAEDCYSRFLGRCSHVRVVAHARIKWAKFVRFWLLFARYRPDVIVFAKGIPYLFPLSAHVAARMSGARRLASIEQLMWDPAPAPSGGIGILAIIRRVIGWRTRFMLARRLQGRLAHVTICVSESLRRRLTTEYGYPENRTITIHNGADLRYFASANGAEAIRSTGDAGPDYFTIVCVARLSHVKRIDLLLDALSTLSRSHRDWRCFILGSGPKEKDLRAQVATLGLETVVTFMGHVDDVRPYLRQADVAVLSSENEGLPLSLAEAMAMGVPCIASDVGGTGEIVCHGRTGLLFTSGSAEELSQAISYLRAHEEERRRMGEEAKQWVHEHFDIERVMTRVSNVILA
jgi:glycosyltransferase involved in cell wall biosynthesis